MKKLLAFLVLLSHMNFSMFIPQVGEVDHVMANGRPVDDINSLNEYIDQVILGHEDDTPEDEDDDQARYFSLYKIAISSANRFATLLRTPVGEPLKTSFPQHQLQKLPFRSFDIQSPPPEA